MSNDADFESNLQSCTPLHAPYVALLRAALDDDGLPQRRTLDIGCGTGAKSHWLAEQLVSSGQLIGMDCDRRVLAAAARRHGGAAHIWLCGDALALPCADRSVDRCWCIAALHLFGDEQRALREMRRVLHIGGTVVVVLVERRWVRLRHWPAPVVAAACTCQLAPADELGRDLMQQLATAGFAGVTLRAYALDIANDDPQAAALALTNWSTLAPQLPDDEALHRAGAASEDSAEIEEIAVLFALRGHVVNGSTRF
ncbi:class I SAM-dependent methyltransferase [Candidatus Gracilibacteria bacterium]|nr:class I SAM-dependent methyltransferase [Candidatus Gracilibacteria bacterium]